MTAALAAIFAPAPKHGFDFWSFAPAIFGTVACFLFAWIVRLISSHYISTRVEGASERYRKRKVLNMALVIFIIVVLIILWSRRLQNTGAFLGLIAAGVAVALKDPLLSIFGRFAILAGGMYAVGDRIEIGQMKGDVIDIGFFFTRMMEVGNWIEGELATGRTIQFLNSKIFDNPIFNYTHYFGYIWDEIHLPITYASNMQAAIEILLDAAGQYSKAFFEAAQADLSRMRESFFVSKFELNPQVYVKVTSNWIGLSLRYLVAPRERQNAISFIFRTAFERIGKRNDIEVSSETMTISIQELAQLQRRKAGESSRKA